MDSHDGLRVERSRGPFGWRALSCEGPAFVYHGIGMRARTPHTASRRPCSPSAELAGGQGLLVSRAGWSAGLAGLQEGLLVCRGACWWASAGLPRPSYRLPACVHPACGAAPAPPPPSPPTLRCTQHTGQEPPSAPCLRCCARVPLRAAHAGCIPPACSLPVTCRHAPDPPPALHCPRAGWIPLRRAA